MTIARRVIHRLCRQKSITFAAAIFTLAASTTTATALSAGTGQTCNHEATGNPVAFAPPPDGTKIRFEDVSLRGGAEQTRRELDYTSRAGGETEMEWAIHLASGQALAVRTFLGLLQTDTSSGTANSFDRNRYATLWPLDSGKNVEFDLTTSSARGAQYTSRVSMCVSRFEKLELSAGTFNAVVIDTYRQIVQGGERLPFDEVYTRFWYVPQFGIYLQRVRAMFRQKREVMKQTRRAISIEG